jgi:hypothetical protein
LPSGIQLQASGVIAGTTALTGSYPFTAEVTDSSGQTATRAFTLTVSSTQQVLDVDNLYCPTDGGPTWGQVDSFATLPEVCFNTAMANTPANGAMVNVSTTAQLKLALAALSTLTCGERIILTAGMVYSGNFLIPQVVCPTGNWIYLQSSMVSSLPAESARYTTTYTSSDSVNHTVTLPQFGPCYAGVTSLPGRPPFNCPAVPGTYTAQLISPNGNAALTFVSFSTAVRLIGLEVTRTTGTGYVNSLINSYDQNLSYIILDRVWCHGDENEDETKLCLDTSTDSYMAVVDSYLGNFYCVSAIGACTDAHAIGGGDNDTLNYTSDNVEKFVNNFIEASGENIIYGGAPSIKVPANFEIRLNTFFKPLQWNPSDPAYNGGVRGHALIVKNLFELKNANLVLLEGNQMFNNWAGFSQDGTAVLLTPKNGNNECPICSVANVTVRYNTINSSAGAFQLVVTEDDSGHLSVGGNNWSVHDNVADNQGFSTCYDCFNLTQAFQIWAAPTITSASQTLYNVSVNHNTVVFAPSLNGTHYQAGLAIAGPLTSGGAGMFNISFINNILWPGGAGTSNPLGTKNSANCSNVSYGYTPIPVINNCYNPNTFGGNCFVANGSISWPGTNVTSVTTQSGLYTSYRNGDGGDYTIATGSRCQGAATDGSDPGANIAAVAAVIAGTPSPTIP